jgi:hypothetical protein
MHYRLGDERMRPNAAAENEDDPVQDGRFGTTHCERDKGCRLDFVGQDDVSVARPLASRNRKSRTYGIAEHQRGHIRAWTLDGSKIPACYWEMQSRRCSIK